MTDIATLAEVKAHLRVTHSNEDGNIEIYMDAAEDWIYNYLNDANPSLNGSIKAAFLLFVGDLFENREATTDKNLSPNKAITNLLYPYREDIGI